MFYKSCLSQVLTPPGWVVEPAQVEIFVDGESDPCSLHQDLNFDFKGYSVFGSVRRSEKQDQEDLGRIALTLKSDDDDKVVQRAFSAEDGSFSFSGLGPGSYSVRLSEESLQSYSFKVKEQRVAVRDGSAELAPFVIVGYDVEGRVADSSGKSPVSGVPVSLLSSDGGGGGKPLAAAKSDDQGRFQFANVSRGAYSVRVEAPQGMAFQALAQDAKVFDKNVVLEPFRMLSFDLKGSVLMSKGKPAAGVLVKAEQKGQVQEARTDKDGNYVVKSSCVCELTVQPELEEAKFDKLTLKVDPTTELPALLPKEFRVSGALEGAEAGGDLRAALVGRKDKKVAASAKIGSDGRFSLFVPPGSYSAEIQNEKGAKETVFTSDSSSVEVKSAPVGGVRFKVASFSVSGALKCFAKPCNRGVRVLLKSEKGSGRSEAAEVEESGAFALDEVPFGRYVLEVEDDARCWRDNRMALKVDRDHSGLEFEQKGGVMAVESSHATTLVLTDAKKKSSVQEFELNPGRNVICVDGNADMEVSANGCYRFDSAPPVVNDRTDRLTLAAKSFKVSGQIKTSSAIKDVKLTLNSDKQKDVDVSLTKTGAGYDFELFAEKGESVTLTPSSKEAFFDPKELSFTPRNDCKDNTVSFAGKKGLFVRGKVVPAVEGVAIRVEGGDGGQEATTAKDGSFQIGPFAEEAPRAKLAAAKEGYSFEDAGEYGVFKSQVLSSISIRVSDDKKEPLPDDAVVSVSSGKNFRSSAHLKDGAVKFASLLPGEYFVKVFLKEWVFEPKHVVIDLEEDANVEKALAGKRVAYSLHGRVSYPNGRPAQGVVVLAQGSGKCSGQIEDASSSGPQGAFRLRGLEPGCKYELKSGNPSANTFVLQQPNVTMSEADFRLESPILCQESPDTFHLAVLVRASPEEQARLRKAPVEQAPPAVSRQVTVEARSGDRVVVTKMFTVRQDRLKVLPALPAGAGQYTVTVDRGAPAQTVDPAAGSLHYLTFETRESEDLERRRGAGGGGGGSAAFTLAVAAAIAGAAFYWKNNSEKK